MTAGGPRSAAGPRRHGLTLLELVVVLAIVGMLAVMLVPAVQASREMSRDLVCRNHLAEMGKASVMYHDARGRFPAGSLIAADGTSWGLTVPLLPYMEERQLRDVVVLDRGGACEQIRGLQAAGRPDPAGRRLPWLHCPSDPQAGRSLKSGPSGPLPTSGDCGTVHPGNYLGVAGAEEAVDATLPVNKCFTSRGIAAGSGLFYDDSRTAMRDVTDGLSKTLALGERGLPDDLGWGWVMAGGQECEQYLGAARGVFRPTLPGNAVTADEALLHWWSWHPGGVNFALADGSARVVSPDVDHAVFRALATRAGGEAAAVP
jgi:prepilin-type N-terminal cleavage/methylation domain-containing protein/prepilin-type processing-associated H-X9-DG protein